LATTTRGTASPRRSARFRSWLLAGLTTQPNQLPGPHREATEQRSWETPEGEKRSVAEIEADEVGGSLKRIAAVEGRIKAAVAQSKTSLLELFGVGPVLAARFLGEVGDVRRFPSKHHFAAHTGTAPLAASGGQVVRHRLSRAGDRNLNHALYMMAMAQVRRPSAGQVSYRRKLAEGKSPKEALRCLKRRLSDAVYRCLAADQHLQPSPVGWRGVIQRWRPQRAGQARASCQRPSSAMSCRADTSSGATLAAWRRAAA
jgi:transposase